MFIRACSFYEGLKTKLFDKQASSLHSFSDKFNVTTHSVCSMLTFIPFPTQLKCDRNQFSHSHNYVSLFHLFIHSFFLYPHHFLRFSCVQRQFAHTMAWTELEKCSKEMQLHKKSIKHEINSVICLQATGQSIKCWIANSSFIFMGFFSLLHEISAWQVCVCVSFLCIKVCSLLLFLFSFSFFFIIFWNVLRQTIFGFCDTFYLFLWCYYCETTSCARHNCQGQAIKIIIKNNGNKPNLMVVCVRLRAHSRLTFAKCRSNSFAECGEWGWWRWEALHHRKVLHNRL